MTLTSAQSFITQPFQRGQLGFGNLFRLTGYGWRHKWHMLGSWTTMALATLAGVAIPTLLGTSIDSALESGLQGTLFLMAGSILLVTVIRGLLEYAEAYLSASVSQKAAYELRNDFFTKLQLLSFGFHDRYQTGDLMSRATADVEAVRGFLGNGIMKWIRIALTLGTISYILLNTNLLLGLICITFIPIVAIGSATIFFKLKNLWSRQQIEMANMTTVLQENLTGVRVVKAFGAQTHEETRFQVQASSVAENAYRASSLSAYRSAQMGLIVGIAITAIIWIGGREVILDNLTTGQLTSFVLYMGMMAGPIRGITGAVANIAQTVSAGQRLFEILDTESPVKQSPEAINVRRVNGHVTFENVSISYNSHKLAVQNVSFEAKPGELVALLGPPGSGKSSLVHLLPRFYDPSEGKVTLDGIDIRDFSLRSLRSKIGIVLQDIFIFAATIRDNISYGTENASLEEIEEAAKVAQLHDWIDSLPNKYDTWVGERGLTLSGGQRQRLAIARTLLVDPPILILDDSTSSVDVATERQIQRAITEVVKGRTTFVIAHRISTIQNADTLVILNKGQIVEKGSQKELKERPSIFQQIQELQLELNEVNGPVRYDKASLGAGV